MKFWFEMFSKVGVASFAFYVRRPQKRSGVGCQLVDSLPARLEAAGSASAMRSQQHFLSHIIISRKRQQNMRHPLGAAASTPKTDAVDFSMINTETRFVLQPAAAVHLEGWTVDLIASSTSTVLRTSPLCQLRGTVFFSTAFWH